MILHLCLSVLVIVGTPLILGVADAVYASDHSSNIEMEQQKCDMGNSETCFILGGMFAKGMGVQQDYLLAADFYKKACDGGVADGCSSLAGMYQHGKGVKQDNGKASNKTTRRR